MIIVSNTSPLNYLILIGQINLLPALFQQIIIPQAVYGELSDAAAPTPVQAWMATPPDWLTVQPVRQPADAIVNLLDPGEREAILLAQQLNADLILTRRHESTSHCHRKRTCHYGHSRNSRSSRNPEAH